MPKLQAVCPHCDGSFKLKDRRAAGKMVNCPSCGESFRIEPQPADDYDDVDFDDGYDDRGGYEDAYDADDRAPAARSSRKKAKKEPGSNVAGKVVVYSIAGVMGIAFLVAAGFGISWMLKGGDQLDTSYLPVESEVVFHMKVSELAASELAGPSFRAGFRQGMPGPRMGMGMGMGMGGPPGVPGGDGPKMPGPDDIRSITVGVYGLKALKDAKEGGNGDFESMIGQIRFAAVVKSATTLPTGENLGMKPIPDEQDKESKDEYHEVLKDKVAFYRPNTTTWVLGDIETIRQATKVGAGQKSLSKFNFVDGGQDIVFAVKPKNIAELKDEADKFNPADLPGAPDSLKKIVKDIDEGAIGVAFGANVDTDVRVLMQVQTDTEIRATDIESNLDALIDWGRATVDQYRNTEPELAEAFDLVMQDLEIKRKGQTINISLLMSGEKQRQIERLVQRAQQQAVQVAMQRFIPQPRFNPGGRDGEGEVGPGGNGGRVEPVDEGPKDTRPGVGLVEDLVTNARTFAARAADKENLETIGKAILAYHEEHGEFPTGVYDGSGQKLLSWRVQILPQLGEQELYDQFRLNSPWNSPQNTTASAKMPEVFRSPLYSRLQEQANATKSSYIVFQRDTILGDKEVSVRDVTDGLSNTILVLDGGEAYMTDWAKPDGSSSFLASTYLSRVDRTEAKGFNVVFGDGFVRNLSPRVGSDHFKAMLTRAGGEIVDPNDGAVEIGDGPAAVVVDGGDVQKFPVGTASVESVAYSPDGRLLVVGARDEIRVFLVGSGLEADLQEDLRELSRVTALGFSTDGEKLLAGGSTGRILVWNVDADGILERAGVFNGHTSDVQEIAVSENGKVLSGSSKETLAWELATNRFLGRFPIDGKAVWIAKDGKSGLACDGNQFVTLNLEAAAPGTPVKLPHRGSSSDAAFSKDGSKLFCIATSAVVIYDVAKGAAVGALNSGGGFLRTVEVSPDGNSVAAGESRKAYVWTAGTPAPTIHEVEGGGFNQPVDFAPDGSRLAIGGSPVHVVRLAVPSTVPVVPGAGGGEFKIVPTVLAGRLPTDSGRDRNGLVVRISLVGGWATGVKSYGMVQVESAKDHNGRDLRAFPHPEEVDYRARMLDIKPENRTPIGVHTYVAFNHPGGNVESVSLKGTMKVQLTDGTAKDVPFDLLQVQPGN